MISNLRVERIDSFSKLKAIQNKWDELCQDILPPYGHPFNHFSWLYPFAELLEKRGTRLRIFTVYDEDRLVGIAPLCVSRSRWFGIPVVRFIGHFFSDYCDIIFRQDFESRVVRALIKAWESAFSKNTIFDLNHVHEASNTPEILRKGLLEEGIELNVIPWEKAPSLVRHKDNSIDPLVTI